MYNGIPSMRLKEDIILVRLEALQILVNFLWLISPRCILFITGDVAHSKEFSINAHSKAKEPKELYEVEGGGMYIDLYDDISKIPFTKIQSFFDEYLK